jgi:hypothetical protein
MSFCIFIPVSGHPLDDTLVGRQDARFGAALYRKLKELGLDDEAA